MCNMFNSFLFVSKQGMGKGTGIWKNEKGAESNVNLNSRFVYIHPPARRITFLV